jgi:ribose transport system ATP-binding protein
MAQKVVILELREIDKHFGGIHALKNVSFSINKGEVHAIVGENGAGKSTLMKILAGTYQPDSGQIIMEGNEVAFDNPHKAHEAGVNIIYQEFFSFPSLDVVANVFAGKEIENKIFLDEKEMRRRACDIFNRIGVNIDLDATVKNLSVADQQIIEIAKALVYSGKIVIMDEPNSALTDKETLALFTIIKRLKNQGITILYISHRLEEIFQICDRITVLRDGNYMGTWEKEKTDIPSVITQMIGRKLEEAFPEIIGISRHVKPILEVKKLKLNNTLKDINFSINSGEVLGFAGLEGSGIRELFNVLFGLIQFESGEIIYKGQSQVLKFSSEAIKLGWGMIPANRRDHGLIMRWSIKDNISLVVLEKILGFFGLINQEKVENISNEYINKLRISTDSSDKIVLDLSGGNQQKVVISKWLATKPKLLILDDPTRGIDVGAKSEIYHLIQELAKQGMAILFNSSEIDEVLGLSHRILVMRQGNIIKEFLFSEVDKHSVMRYVSGDLSNIKQREFEKQNC